MTTVYDRVKAIVVDKLGKDDDVVTETASVELIMAFEEEFSSGGSQLEISDEDAANIATVSDAVTYLKEHGVTD